LTIPIKSAAYRRNGNIATVINNGYVDTLQDFVADVENGYGVNYPYADNDMNGKIVPCTFGTIDKAKLLRTASAELPFVVNGSIPSVYPVPVIVCGCSSDGNGGLIVPNGTAFTIGESVEYNNLWYCISAISGNTLTFTHAFPSDIVNSTINRCCYETQLSKDSDTTQYKICYPGTTLTYGDVSSFPVVVRDTNRSNSRWYTIQISTVIGTLWERTQSNGNWNVWGPVPAGTNATQCMILVNRYIKQAHGDGKGGRVITSATITDDCKQIKITLKDVFESNLTADTSADNSTSSTADTTTWVELLDVKREYSAEYAWPCAAIGSN
jgi:hypothetical protein